LADVRRALGAVPDQLPRVLAPVADVRTAGGHEPNDRGRGVQALRGVQDGVKRGRDRHQKLSVLLALPDTPVLLARWPPRPDSRVRSHVPRKVRADGSRRYAGVVVLVNHSRAGKRHHQ